MGAYVLHSKHYIADRTVDEIDVLNSAMVESGLLQFYISMKMYDEKRQTIAIVRQIPKQKFEDLKT